MGKKFSRPSDDAEVNVTPLLDIVFIMLIFFIVTATFVYEDGLSPNVPQPTPDNPDSVPPPTMVLTVKADGSVQVDGGRIIDPRSAKPVVGEFMASKPKGVIIVSAEEDSESGIAITVLDQARSAVTPAQRRQITFTLASKPAS